MFKKSEKDAREYIEGIYSRSGIPLPEGWDDPEILESFCVHIARLDHDLATKGEVQKLVADSKVEKSN